MAAGAESDSPIDPMRNRVIDELRGTPEGLDVKELSARLDLHPNSVRWHLGALSTEGLVSAAPAATARRGRPKMIYKLRPAALEGTRDEYRLLATILTGTVAEEGGTAAAERNGAAWGRYLVARPLPLVRRTDGDATAAVVELLDGQGFAPDASGREIRIRRCPFHDLAEAQPEVVCAVHKGLIDGALTELGSDLRVESLDAFVEPDLCVARLSRKRAPVARPAGRPKA
jgi:predicted ArsR family transcriptional regulator